MEWWIVGMVADAVIAVAYFAICAAILFPLARSRQLTSNPLGAATGAVVGSHSWSLRRTYGSLMTGAQLFEGLRKRERQALGAGLLRGTAATIAPQVRRGADPDEEGSSGGAA